jgi:hypothetical protein
LPPRCPKPDLIRKFQPRNYIATCSPRHKSFQDTQHKV